MGWKLDFESVDTSYTDPKDYVVNNWNNFKSTRWLFLKRATCNSGYFYFICKEGGNYGAVLILGYFLATPLYGILDNNVWTWKYI